MKRIFTILLSVAFLSFGVNAQIFTEDFEGSTAGWTAENAWVFSNQASFNSQFFGTNTGDQGTFAGVNDDAAGAGSGSAGRLISPMIDFSNVSANTVLFYETVYLNAAYGGAQESFRVYFSNDGMNWTELYSDAGAGVYEYREVSIPLASLEGEGMGQLAFEYDDSDGWNYGVIVDNIRIIDLPNYDAGLTTSVLPFVSAGEAVTISGSIFNYGVNNITSYEVVWEDATGSIVGSETIFGNIPSYQSGTFTVTPVASAEGGRTYDFSNVCVVVANDAETSNDCGTSVTVSASQTAERLPLMELFTSSTCPPCFTLNLNGGFGGQNLNDYLSQNNANAPEDASIAIIKYQVNWPGSGDHAFNEDVNTRRFYYDDIITGAPTGILDATAPPAGTFAGTSSEVTAAAAKPGYVNLSATHIIDGNDIQVDVKVGSYVSTDATIHVAILDDEYAAGTDASFSNGEPEFHHVLRKMLPDANGTLVTLEDTQEMEMTFNYTYNEVASGYPAQGSFDTHIGSEREIIVFVQSPTGVILNTAISKVFVSNVNELNGVNYNVYPNPTTGIATVDIDSKVTYSVYTVTGQVLATGNAEGKFNVDLSAYDNGFYFISLKDEAGNYAVSKINLVK